VGLEAADQLAVQIDQDLFLGGQFYGSGLKGFYLGVLGDGPPVKATDIGQDIESGEILDNHQFERSVIQPPFEPTPEPARCAS